MVAVALRKRPLELWWSLPMMFLALLIFCGLFLWAFRELFDHGSWWCLAVAGVGVAIAVSLPLAPQYAVSLALGGCCVWSLLGHLWGLLWAVVGGTFLIGLLVSQTTRVPDTLKLFPVLGRLAVLGSLIGIIVWGALYHNWWLLVPWGVAAALGGALLEQGEKHRREADKAELTSRQLQELRERRAVDSKDCPKGD